MYNKYVIDRDDDTYCELCLNHPIDEIFDQREYTPPVNPNKSGYHAIINSDGYNFPVAVCIFCLNEKIYKCNIELKAEVLRFFRDLTFQGE